jgi:tetratricopeptide (TPR) repeat protein
MDRDQIGLLALAIAMLSLGACAAATADTGDLERCRSGEAELAIAACTRFLEQETGKSPADLASAHRARGSAHAKLGQYARSVEDFDRAIQFDAQDFTSYRNRGVAYFALREHAKAAADITQAIRLQPDDAMLFFLRGNAYSAEKLITEALADYDRAIALRPRFAAAFYNRGHLYFETRQYDLAIKDHSKALEIDPTMNAAYTGRGLAYLVVQDEERAIADFESALSINPTHENGPQAQAVARGSLVALLVRRADNEANRRRHAQAIAGYDRAIQLLPGEGPLYLKRGIVLRRSKEFERAIADFDQAIRTPGLPAGFYAASHYQRANANLEQDQIEPAIADYNKAMVRDPSNATYVHDRGWAYFLKGAFDRAILDFTDALRLRADWPLAYGNRGEAFLKTGDFDSAIADLSRALALDPQYTAAYTNRGLAYEAKGERALARADFTAALQAPTKYPDAERARELARQHLGR